MNEIEEHEKWRDLFCELKNISEKLEKMDKSINEINHFLKNDNSGRTPNDKIVIRQSD
jgi:hypothetical protein